MNTLIERLGFSLPKVSLVFLLYLFSQKQSVNLIEFLDYSCGLITSKLNQSVHAFLIRTVSVFLDFFTLIDAKKISEFKVVFSNQCSTKFISCFSNLFCNVLQVFSLLKLFAQFDM